MSGIERAVKTFDGAQEVGETSHAERIENAARSVHKLVGKLESLRDDLRGVHEPPMSDVKTATPQLVRPLVSVLESAPSEIECACVEAADLISQIRDALRVY